MHLGDPPAAFNSGVGSGYDLRAAAHRLERRGVEQRRVGARQTTAESLHALVDAWRPDVLHVHVCPTGDEALLEAARRRSAAVVVSMPDYSWICQRRSCIDTSGVSCLPAVTPGSCACGSGTESLAARNAALRAALLANDVALIPPALSAERLIASGIVARIRVLDAAVEDSSAQLEAAYRDAIEHRRESPCRARSPQLHHVLFVVGASGSPLRYRVHQKSEQLAMRGISSAICWYADPRLPAALERADAVIVYRAPATRQLVQLIRNVRLAGTPTFWDVDDLVFDPETVDELPVHRRHSRREREAWIENAHRYRAMLQECGAGIASTPEVARHMARAGVPAQVLLNGVDTTYAAVFEGVRRAARRRPGDTFTVGYCSGSDTHDEDFEMVAHVLAAFLAAHHEARLLLVGPLSVPPELERLSDRITSVGWVPAMEVPRYLAQFDLNIAPLVDHDFTNGKSAIKWSEAALVGVPSLVSATEPFRMAVENGRTGLLAADTHEFAERLEHAIAHRSELPRMAEAARLAAFQLGSPWVLGARLTQILATTERTPIWNRETRWPKECSLTEIEPPGVIPGLVPEGRGFRPGERLDDARVGFRYPLEKGPLRRADVLIASWHQPVRSPLGLRIRVGPTILATATVAPQDAMDNAWVAFTFDPPVAPVSGAVAELSADGHGNVAPYVGRHGVRLVDGIRVRGAVVARTFHQPPVPPDFEPRTAGSPPSPNVARIAEWLSVPPRVLHLVRRITALAGARSLSGRGASIAPRFEERE